MIYLVGLGTRAGEVSQKALELFDSGKKIILKNSFYSWYISGNYTYESLDFIYQKSRNFDTLNKNLAKHIITLSKNSDIVYCVDGSPEEDISCQALQKSRSKTTLLPSVTKSSYIFNKCSNEISGYFKTSAYDLKDYNFNAPLVVYNIDCDYIASLVKLYLSNFVGDEQEIFFVNNDKSSKIKLYELDRQKEYDNLTGIYVPEYKLSQKKRFIFSDVVQILEILRAENGCAWDAAQTHESIKQNAIEEAYELADAIDKQDDEKITEESGDVLLQSLFHAVIANERGAFNCEDITTMLCQKLINRHSHIFGSDKVYTESGALETWEKNKYIEKGHITTSDALVDVPKNFPAAMYAQKLQKRAAKSGFDFENLNQAFGKIFEELKELEDAIKIDDKNNIKEECGDLLFSAINISRLLKVDSEAAIKETSNKFLNRFIAMENLIIKDKKNIQDLSAKELDGYYNAAKKN